MSVRVRLTRVGSKKNPIWRVVVADQRSPRDGRCIETIGHYNPQTDPSTVTIDRDRLQHWLDRGAEPTNTVRKLMRVEPGAVPAAVATEAEADEAAEPPAAGAPPEDAAVGAEPLESTPADPPADVPLGSEVAATGAEPADGDPQPG